MIRATKTRLESYTKEEVLENIDAKWQYNV